MAAVDQARAAARAYTTKLKGLTVPPPVPNATALEGFEQAAIEREAAAAFLPQFTAIEQLQGQVSSLQAEKQALEASVATLTAKVAELEAKETALLEQVSTQEATIGTLQATVEVLEAESAALKAEIEELKKSGGDTGKVLVAMAEGALALAGVLAKAAEER